MAQTLQTISVISFAVAGVSFVLAVFFWFFFKIPTVIGDLSGRTARKSIAKMRTANEKSGVKSYKESKVNMERGKVTGTIPGAGKAAPIDPEKPETGVLEENKAESRGIGSETTGLLIDENETAPLDMPAHKHPAFQSGKKLEMIEQIMIIHTDEVIR